MEIVVQKLAADLLQGELVVDLADLVLHDFYFEGAGQFESIHQNAVPKINLDAAL